MTELQPGELRGWTSGAAGLELDLAYGRMRVGFPAERIARILWSPGAPAPRRSSDVVPADDALDWQPYECVETGESISIRSGRLEVRVGRADATVSFHGPTGETFGADARPMLARAVNAAATRLRPTEQATLPVGPARAEVELRKRMAPGEVYYGFGQRIGHLDRRGRVLTNWTVDPEAGHSRSHDNLYQSHPVFLALRPGLAWGAFMHSSWYSQFDVGATEPDELRFSTLGGELDYFVFLGPTPAEVVERLTWLTGRPLLPPLWALGYHQSRWSYMNEEIMRGLVDQFRARRIPLDATHFDIDYMDGYRDFTWNPERFPDPAGLIAHLRERGCRAVTIVDPGVKADLDSDYRVARKGLAEGHFLKHADGSPFVGYCWPDAVFFPDFASAEARQWWGEQHSPLLEAGVAGIWNDMNEPAVFERPFSEGASEQSPMPLDLPQGTPDEPATHAELHNLYGLLMSRSTFEGLQALRPDVRPWVLTRSGYTGVQRYAAAWMGDNSSWWEHLDSSLPQLMSMGMSGVPHVGVDIGGFFENCTPELYARWVSLGTFYPFMRTHSAVDTRQQEPWSFGPEVEEIARRAIRLRYRLLPYIYTLAHRAHRSGEPMLRPLAFDFPDDTRSYHVDDQAMFGPALLIAPICRPGVDHRSVYLPAGRWYELKTGARLQGGGCVLAPAPLGEVPVYVRGGSILTLGNERLSTSEPLTELSVEVYPADGTSDWRLIEDDGVSFSYAHGGSAETAVRVEPAEDRVRVQLDARQGSYRPHPRSLRLVLHLEREPRSVLLDGVELRAWSWKDERAAVELQWEDDGSGRVVEARL